MTAQIRFFWARLNANYWFYPALFSVLAGLLAFAMIWLDRSGWAGTLNREGWIVPARPQGATNMLTVMAGSMIGVASTVFSITIAAVAYASGTYGPRLLTNFMEDRGNQLSLATFIATFVYALIVLRSVRGEDETAAAGGAADAMPGFVPQLSLLVAYGLMAICVGVLVYFLNHVPSSIRINTVLEGIASRLLAMIRDTYPVEDEFGEAREQIPGTPVVARATGYIQLIDFEGLARLCQKHGTAISLKVRTGDFIHRDLPLLELAGGGDDDVTKDVCACFTFGPSRTPDQDPQFLIDELVEIGLRALSPGINDPFTAITALHWLGAATAEIGRRDLRKDIGDQAPEECPVIPLPDDFAHYLRRGFGSIRSAVATSPIAAEVMLDTLANAAVAIASPDRRKQLREEGRLLGEQALLALAGPDRDALRERLRTFESRLAA